MFQILQFVEWFDLAHVSRSAAQFNPEKLRWLNHQYLKKRSDAELKAEVAPRVKKNGGKLEEGPDLEKVIGLFKDRAETLEAAAEAVMIFYTAPPAQLVQLDQSLTDDVRRALEELVVEFRAIEDWNEKSVMGAVHAVLDKHKLKLPKIAIPLRLIVFGTPQTPNLGAVLERAEKKRVLERLEARLTA